MTTEDEITALRAENARLREQLSESHCAARVTELQAYSTLVLTENRALRVLLAEGRVYAGYAGDVPQMERSWMSWDARVREALR